MIGARVKQARLLAGLTQQELASQLGERGYRVTKAAISKYENNKSFPPAGFLLDASMVLGVRSTYFTHQPAKTIEWQSFRRHSTLSRTKQDAVKAHATDLAELHIELHSLLYPDKSPNFLPPAPVHNLEDAEAAAGRLRTEWDLGDRPLDNLVQMAEDRSVVVIGWDDESGKFDGLSGWCGKYPVAVINTSRSTERIRFNLAHEIGHLVMDTRAVSDRDAEKLAHRFAAAFLVLAEHAYHELGPKRSRLDWGELKMLKRKYGLSMSAWIRRAKDLGIITEHHYTELNIEIKTRGWHKKEPGEYIGDEEPLQLQQMAIRAVAEGLMSPDRITRVGVECLDFGDEEAESGHLTVGDLLKMPEAERDAIVQEAFALAENEDFEIFEAYGIGDEDFDDGAI